MHMLYSFVLGVYEYNRSDQPHVDPVGSALEDNFYVNNGDDWLIDSVMKNRRDSGLMVLPLCLGSI
jgi:hypothetical protein